MGKLGTGPRHAVCPPVGSPVGVLAGRGRSGGFGRPWIFWLCAECVLTQYGLTAASLARDVSKSGALGR